MCAGFTVAAHRRRRRRGLRTRAPSAGPGAPMRRGGGFGSRDGPHSAKATPPNAAAGTRAHARCEARRAESPAAERYRAICRGGAWRLCACRLRARSERMVDGVGTCGLRGARAREGARPWLGAARRWRVRREQLPDVGVGRADHIPAQQAAAAYVVTQAYLSTPSHTCAAGGRAGRSRRRVCSLWRGWLGEAAVSAAHELRSHVLDGAEAPLARAARAPLPAARPGVLPDRRPHGRRWPVEDAAARRGRSGGEVIF